MPLNINPPGGNGNNRNGRSGGKTLRMDKSSCDDSEPTPVVVEGPVDATIINTCDNPVPIEACEPLDVNIVSSDVPDFHYEKTGYLCGPNDTWVCTLLSWINGEQQDPVEIDSGISCEEPAPTDVELKEIRTCVDGFEQIQFCQITFVDGVPQTPVNVGDPVETGIACNVVAPLVLGTTEYCVTGEAAQPTVGTFTDVDAFLASLSNIDTQSSESFSGIADGSYTAPIVTPSGTWEHRDYNAAGLFAGTSRTLKIETPLAQNGASVAVAGVETTGGGTTSQNSIIHCLASPVGFWGADLLDMESNPAFAEAKVIAYDAALNPIIQEDNYPDGSDIVQFGGIVSPANDIAYVQIVVGDNNGGTLSDQLALTNVVFGTLGEADGETDVYCEVTTLEDGVKVKTIYGPDGSVVPALPEGAEPCDVEIVPVDYEYIRVPVCADDTNLLAQYEYLDGVLSPDLIFFDMLGDEVSAPAQYDLGWCEEPELDVTSQPICIDGVAGVLKTYVNSSTQFTIAQQFCDNNGEITPAPLVWTYGACEGACEKTPVDYKKQEYYFGVENTKTRFNFEYEACLTLTNGEVRDVTLPSAGGWLAQMTAWQVALSAAVPEACEVANHWNEWRDGLPTDVAVNGIPPNDMTFDAARGQFIQFTFCPDAVEFMPIGMTFKKRDGADWVREAIVDTDVGKIEYITHCLSCDPECQEDAPKCSIPVAADFPELPTPSCTSSIVAGNWCDIDLVAYEDPDNTDDPLIQSDIIIIATSCDGGVPSLEYFTQDADGNLDEYQVQGVIRDCDNYDNAPEAPTDCRPKGSYTGKTFCYEKKSKFVLVEKQFDGTTTADVSAQFGLPAGSIVATHDAVLFSGANNDILAAGPDGADPVTFAVSGTQPVCLKVQHGGSIPTDGASDGFTSNDGVTYAFTGNITGDGTVSNTGNDYQVTSGTDNVQGGINWTSQGPATSATAFTTNLNARNSVRFWVATFDCGNAREYVSDCGEIVQWWDGNVQVDITKLTESDCCKEKCGVPTGKTSCYGTAGGEGSSYTNSDNTTDISYSNNQTTIKWSVDAGLADGSGEYTLAIAACIDSGETAYLTITDSAGVTTNFAADTILAQGNANGSGGWAFTGAGGPSFSGKVVSSSFTCGVAGESGKAQQFYDCVSNTYNWVDCLDPSKIISVDDLTDCPVETVPVLDSIEVIQCSTEDGDGFAVGDYILFIGQTTDGVLTSSTAYNLSQGSALLDNPPETEPCEPSPEITELRNCLVDTNGNIWTQVLVYLADTNPANPPVLDTILYYDAAGLLGTPAGEPKEWTPCANDSGLVDIEKVCFEYFGQEVKGYAFAYSDGEVQLGTNPSPDSAVSVNPNATYCCDDCIQVFGCRDGRLAFPAGATVEMANGDSLDIAGLRYSQVAQLIVDTYGGTFSAPSLGGPQGPNFSQCQGSSQHELQMTNVPVKILSITEMDSYGTFGNCSGQAATDKLCEIVDLLTDVIGTPEDGCPCDEEITRNRVCESYASVLGGGYRNWTEVDDFEDLADEFGITPTANEHWVRITEFKCDGVSQASEGQIFGPYPINAGATGYNAFLDDLDAATANACLNVSAATGGGSNGVVGMLYEYDDTQKSTLVIQEGVTVGGGVGWFTSAQGIIVRDDGNGDFIVGDFISSSGNGSTTNYDAIADASDTGNYTDAQDCADL